MIRQILFGVSSARPCRLRRLRISSARTHRGWACLGTAVWRRASSKTMTVRRLPPLHAGEVLREEFLLSLKLSPYALAKALGVPRTRVERLVREETALTADTRIAVVSLLRHDRGILDKSASRPRVGDRETVTRLEACQDHAQTVARHGTKARRQTRAPCCLNLPWNW